jgi:cytochrome c553
MFTPFGTTDQRSMCRVATKYCRSVCIFLGLLCVQSVLPADEARMDFRTQIAPIFEHHCVRCHSPSNNKGDISLATIDDLKSNEHVIAGDPDNSHLIELVTGVDGESPAMPKGADALSKEQIAALRRWIQAGAEWPRDVIIRDSSRADSTWWSLQPLNETVLSTNTAKSANADSDDRTIATIDNFIQAKLAEQNLSLNPPADRRTLIRRATYDLIGLPPTPEEVESFVSDPDPLAYRKLINRLLESPHYGERWGRHWMDVVRFGESNGYERNVVINSLWPFRDYVISSINEDKPFDQFIREHIAGDVFGQDDPTIAIGSAFLVAGPYDDVGNQDPAQAAQIRANTLDEIIRATSEAFLGMTLGCARCHDHKFDPITQQDYYGLYATFSGIRHGAVELATPEDKARRDTTLNPLNDRKSTREQKQTDLRAEILKRAKQRLAEYEARWTRPPVDRTGTEEHFERVTAKFVRLVCESRDNDPNSSTGFNIDEFEVWSTPEERHADDTQHAETGNLALAANGGKATGRARRIDDFPNAYGVQHAIDGKTGGRFIAAGNDLTIELAEPTLIDHVVFSSAKGEQTPEQGKFAFVGEYRIEVSDDGNNWREVANGRDRILPDGNGHLDRRLLELETSSDELAEQTRLVEELKSVNEQIARVPTLPSVWIGKRVSKDAQGPFHVFVGGSPQNKGESVVPASLSVFNLGAPEVIDAGSGNYRLSADAPEAERRVALADWIVHSDNPVTPRVLANRLWHYHFGTGIVDTPSDFGYMGGRPTHPELLDFLALKLTQNGWRLKELHRLIMTSQTYMQSSEFRADAAKVDGDSRLLWRFPPRRLSAEEVRDAILSVAGTLERSHTLQNLEDSEEISQSSVPNSHLVPDGGPGFRLYQFQQDNVCTYVPLDKHGPETYRRAVYHQNARATVIDLMTDFDQPDCTFSSPRRAETTTPLQALTMLNHSFTLDMARTLADRLQRDSGDDPDEQIRRVYKLCYSRTPTSDESTACRELMANYGLAALCRVLLNTSEMIYVR